MRTDFDGYPTTRFKPFIWIDLNDEDFRSAKAASDNINQLCEELGAGSDKRKREAISWLYYARTTGNSPECIKMMRTELKAGGHTIADIGLTEVAIIQIIRDYHKREAKRWLEAARTTGVAPACIDYVRDHVKQGNWTLVDIDTSEDDLKMVVRNYESKRQHA